MPADRNRNPLESALWNLPIFFLCLYACALPWDLFQRLPVAGLTLTKIAALGVTASAIVSAIVRRRISFRWGILEVAVAIFALACVASAFHSADLAATKARLVLYTLYAVFLFSAIEVVRSPRDTRWPLTCFAVSTGCVGAYTLGCYFGWIWPAFWGAAFWPQQRLILEYAAGVPLRMAAVSADFNAASMLLVTGFGAAIFLYDGRPRTRRVQMAMYILKAAMACAMAIAMSRSALLLCAALIVLRMSRKLGRRTGWWVATAVVVGAAGILVATQSTFVQTLFHRLAGGFTYDEPSLRGRKQVYFLALQLLRQYGISGCGLGAIDTVLAQPDNVDVAVMTVHSMPLALWIELGVLGILGWGLLWLAVVRDGIVYWRRIAESEDRGLASAFLAMCFGVFGMTLVQPFATSALYPFVLCLCFGPLRGHLDRSSNMQPAPRPAVAIALACAISWIVVVANSAAYQITARETFRYASALDNGMQFERYGQWEEAGAAYETAATFGARLSHRAYYNVAAGVIDVAPLLASLGVLEEFADPYAAAQYAFGNSLLARGDVDSAEKAFATAWSADPLLGHIKFDLAEAFWRAGKYQKAFDMYEQAARFESKPLNAIDVRNLTRLETRIAELRASELATPNRRLTGFFQGYLRDPETGRWMWPQTQRVKVMRERLIALEHATSESELLERALLQRRLGQIDASTKTYEAVIAAFPKSAEALFGLGVKAEVDGQIDAALARYHQAVDAVPEHEGASQAIERLARTDSVK